MKIGLAQINTTVGDLEGNYNKITNYINQAKKAQCDIVVFPELAITGYPPEDLLYKDQFIQDQMKYVQKIIEETKDILVILGYADGSYQDHLYNACVAFYNGEELATHFKKHLPNYSVFDEKRYFNTMNNPAFPRSYGVFFYKGKKIAMNICEDIWIDEGIAKKQSKENPDIMINISCSPYYCKKVDERRKLLVSRAKEYNTIICYCNLVGGQDELVFDGASMIIDKNGDCIASGSQFEEDLVLCDLSQDGLKYGFYPNSRQEEIWSALKLGLGDYIKKNGFKKVVLGMSGGIDSALVAKLAVDTIGKENVVCISMPSQYSSKGTQSDAESYSKELGVYFNTFPIQNLFEGYVNYLNPYFKGHGKGVTEENLQARIRGNIIMAFSNKFGFLPIVCSNKSETAVGYFTHFGDNAGGFSPIKDLYKTDVIKLAKYVGVPDSIINRPPSAELREDQKDCDSLPPYDVLDEILKKLMERNESPKTEVENKIYKLILRSEWKRRYSPCGIKIQREGWGKDWRFPITNGYNYAI